MIHINLYEFDKAEHLIECAIELSRALNNRSCLIECYRNKGLLLTHKKIYSDAVDFFNQSIEICEDIHDQYQLQMSLGGLAACCIDMERYDDSLRTLEKQYGICVKLGFNRGKAQCIANKGLANLGLNNTSKGIDLLLEAGAMCEKSEFKQDLLWILELLIKFYHANGDIDCANKYKKAKKEANEHLISYYDIPKPDKNNIKQAADGVVFLYEKKENNYRYLVYEATNKSNAMKFLQKNPVTEKLVYILVNTPDGGLGRDIDGIYHNNAADIKMMNHVYDINNDHN